MIETERNKRKTDRAWNTLYQRLDEEGLLSGRPASPFRSPAWKRGVAAAAVALHAAGVQVVAALHFNIARDFQIGIAHNIALIRAADHIVQTAGRGWVDIAAGGNHYMSFVHCGFVAAAVECFA